MKIILGGSHKKDPKKFQNLTDHVLFAQIIIWQTSKDKLLSDLSRRLIRRGGIRWKEIEKNILSLKMIDKVNSVREYLKKEKLDPKYYFFEDQTQAIAYKPYRSASEEEEQSSVTSIMLYDSSWKGTGFSEVSDVPGLQRLKAITEDKPSPIMRYCFPEEHEKQIKRLLS